MTNDGSVFNAQGKINRLAILTISAYEIAVKNGFKGTEEEWLDSLNGGLITVDKQLYKSGHAADAAVTGTKITNLEEQDKVFAARASKLEEQEKVITDLETNLEEQDKVLAARLNTIIANANNTDGNSELVDIRVGHNGTQYEAAGEAVRGQIAGVHRIINEIAGLNPTAHSLVHEEFEKGGITSGGVDSTYRQAARARNIGIQTADHDMTIVAFNGVACICVYFYDADGTYVSVTDWCTACTIPAGSYYRLLVTLDPYTSTEVDLSEILANFYVVNEYKIIKQVDDIIKSLGESVNPIGTRITASNFATLLPDMDAAVPNKLYSVYRTSTCTIGHWPEGVSTATFVTLTPEIGDGKETYKVQMMFDIAKNTVLIRCNVSSTWSEWTTLGAGSTGAPGATGLILYVATNGNDNADGSSAYPLATFTEAIRRGATTIIGEPGTYAQTISVSGVNNLTIRAKKKSYSGSFQDALNPKIILDNSETMAMESYADSVYRAEYTAASTSRMYKVFVSKELDIVDGSGSEAVGYNASIWEKCADIADDVKLVPVATLAECTATEKTFFYDGTHVYVHPADGTITDKTFVIPADINTIVNIENCDNLVLEDIQTEYGLVYGIKILNCRNAMLTDCNAHHNTNGEGFRLDCTNAKLSHCKAHKNRNDGFNFHENGYTELFDCCALYNGDDGASHHQGCSGTINGGEYSHNGSGGVTPAFGAEVNVYNAILRGNKYGLQAINATGYASRTILAMNNVMSGNEVGLYVKKCAVVGMNKIVGNGTNISIATGGTYTDFAEIN